MKTLSPLFFRFIAAGMVAFFVSLASGPIIMALYGEPEGVSEILQACRLVVFSGVVVAAFCLPQAARAVGALALLGAGLIFYCCTDYLRARSGDTFLQDHPHPLFRPIVWGGVAAAIVHLIIYTVLTAIKRVRAMHKSLA